ncbi:MAG: hypothetical protein EXS52_00785, partial [Candidatus Staskawiczbacteria bacterium]|nr:hypothetical protein [Candidatus Staskawiczbacteria bacterium]
MPEQFGGENLEQPKEEIKTGEAPEAVEVKASPEELEGRELRKQFIQTAKDFLTDDFVEADIEGLSNEELGEHIQRKFQENLENFFKSSGLEEEIKKGKDDDELLQLITHKTAGVGGWADMLPNTIKENKGAGMNCTMGSAMLHTALEKLGFENVRTVLVKGHHIVLRELENGSIKLYDSGSKTTKDGKLLGYSQTFTPEQITNKEEVDENSGRKGFSFIVNRGERDDWGGFHIPDKDGNFTKKLYAYDPSIKMDVSIALDNLGCVEADAKEIGGVKDRQFIDESNYLQQVAEFLRQNNQTELTDEDLRTIARENTDAKTEFMKVAEQSVISGS